MRQGSVPGLGCLSMLAALHWVIKTKISPVDVLKFPGAGDGGQALGAALLWAPSSGLESGEPHSRAWPGWPPAAAPVRCSLWWPADRHRRAP